MATANQENTREQSPDRQSGEEGRRDQTGQPRDGSGHSQANDRDSKSNQEGQNGGQQNQGGDKDGGDKKDEEKPVDPRTKRRRLIIGITVGAVLLVVGLGWYLYSTTYEDTDDAQVDGHLNPIASRVGGTVTGVYAENDQLVKAGQPLIDLDPRDYQVQVAQARASYEQALAKYAAQNPNVPITAVSNRANVEMDRANIVNAGAAVASAEADYESNLSKLQQAEASNRKSQSDLVRYKKLFAEQEISQSDYDQYVSNADSEAAQVEASRSAAAASAKIVDERKAQLGQQQTKLSEDVANSPRQLMIQKANVSSSKADVDSAKAQLDTALLNLSYCHIIAPVDGIASQRSAEIGARISEGQQLIVLVQVNNDWITANFKETQLKKMRVGQRVSIKVDSLGESFEGKVQDMPADTGDRASLFPPENATGNYVKVVQRLAVRVSLNPNQPDLDRLRPGMSAEPKVHF